MQLRSWPWILYKHQVRLRISSTLQITSAERERWLSTLCRLKKYLAATMTKERDSTALTLMNIAIRRLAWVHIPIDTFARKHPWCLLLANILTEYTANHNTTVCVLTYSTIINMYVAVNFLSQVFFIFLLFVLHQLTLIFSIPKNTERKTKITWDKKLTTT